MTYVNAAGSSMDDGRWVHRVSQSFVSSAQMCPEQARAQYFDEIPRSYTDSTALGESFHEGVEYALYEKRDGVRLATVDEMVDVARHALDEIGSWKYTKYSRASMYDALVPMYEGWNRDIQPTVDPLLIEWKFDYLLHADKYREVRVVGTVDCVDADYMVWDWKTASREHEPWEKQRWAVQPTVYSYAIDTYLQMRSNAAEPMPPSTFRYGVVFLDGDTQVYDVTRDESHVQWLRQQCSQLAWMIENNPGGPWMLNDAGWHCSPKWCGKFDICKGSHGISDGWAR